MSWLKTQRSVAWGRHIYLHQWPLKLLLNGVAVEFGLAAMPAGAEAAVASSMLAISPRQVVGPTVTPVEDLLLASLLKVATQWLGITLSSNSSRPTGC